MFKEEQIIGDTTQCIRAIWLVCLEAIAIANGENSKISIKCVDRTDHFLVILWSDIDFPLTMIIDSFLAFFNFNYLIYQFLFEYNLRTFLNLYQKVCS